MGAEKSAAGKKPLNPLVRQAGHWIQWRVGDRSGHAPNGVGFDRIEGTLPHSSERVHIPMGNG